ncbi:hypothetical protein [Campylobacter upsaliensis]|uniref:SLAC1 family transporter n=1 Tax=Campylobacter upsaliensis TaxID=28080 RepID=UPI00214A4509|nr:hypothetical protein [Campylobacter upsaliensis]MCR2099324.1 hypothetical protein [Campylobacter upsaliensis]
MRLKKLVWLLIIKLFSMVCFWLCDFSIDCFALLFVCYGAKILYYFKAFKADLTHQVKINFLSSIPISMLIITAFWSDFRKFLCGECFTAYFKLICDEFLV